MDIALRNYLEDVRTLEKDVYSLRQVIEELQQEIQKPPILPLPTKPNGYQEIRSAPKENEMPSIPSDYRVRSIKKKLRICFVVNLILFLSIVFIAGPNEDKIPLSILSLWGFATTASLLGVIGFYIGLRSYKSNYYAALEQYCDECRRIERENKAAASFENDCQKYEESLQDINAQNAHIQKETDENNLIVRHQIATVKHELNQIESVRKELYSKEIIYKKYRGLVPISMFCEYMDSRRRDKLEGIDGMYDLYETELSAKLIINNLQEINNNLATVIDDLGNINVQLGGIMVNQQLLYREVAAGNSIARRIVSELSKQRSTISSIEQTMSNTNQTISEMAATQRILADNSRIASDREEILLRIARNNWE